MIFDLRQSAPHTRSVSPLSRHALLIGTILGAGVLMAPVTQAAPTTFTIDTPQTSTYSQSVTGTDNLTITSTANGSVTTTYGNGITTSAESGTTTITANGAISVDGDGINATSTTGAINIGGTGSISSTGLVGAAIQAYISDSSATADINITSSGSLTNASPAPVIYADNAGSGAINISGLGVVSSSGTRMGTIYANAENGGSINIGGANGLANAVTTATGFAIAAYTTGGNITIKTAAGGTITTNNTEYAIRAANTGTGATTIDLGANVTGGIYANGGSATTITTAAGVKVDGKITVGSLSTDIGGAAGLGGAVTGGIVASAYGNGTLRVKTASGAAVSGAGISTSANNGATTIEVGANVSANGTNAIIAATSFRGAITITTASGAALTGTPPGGANRLIGISASTSGGTIDIGGAAGLGGAITAEVGIKASAGNNTSVNITTAINIKTAAGGSITATNGDGINTFARLGATNITIGAGSTVTGTTNAINATTGNGNVTVTNNGGVKGSLALTNNSSGTGTGTFNNYGVLALNGAQANSGFALNNLSGGVLTGSSTGSFGDVNAASGSIIRPGDRTLDAGSNGVPVMGTLNATSLTLASGAIVEVRADYSGVNDKVAVSGAATLGGATLKVLASPKTDAIWTDKKTFTVLTAGSITGTFADTIQTDYAFLKFAADYSTAGMVKVTSDRNWTSFGTYASTSNQKSVSDVFDKFQTQLSNPVINRVTTLTVQQAPVALSQLSGTSLVTTRTQAVSAKTAFSGAINTEMGKFTGSAGGGSAPLSYAEDTSLKSKAFDKIAPKPEPIPDGRIWAQVLGGWGELRANSANGTPAERTNNFGLAAGADTALTPNLRGGFALALGQSTSKVSSLATTSDATWGQGALYGVLTDGDDYVKGVVTYGYLDNKTDRTVTAFGTNDKAKGKFGSNLVSMRLEAGRKFALDPVALTPFLAFEPSWLFQNAYQETGPASITLGFDKTTTRALPATLGMKADADYELGDLRVTPSATIGWVHDFADTTSISPFFTALPGSNFTTQGAKGDRNLARTELNFEATPKGTLATFYVNARADLGARTTSVRGQAGVSLRF